ncbi:MAG: hypothetical protein KIT83_04595 [Bryobacterales bacterium]|nr:hypothetical protein [Bryobacterales bacterium]
MQNSSDVPATPPERVVLESWKEIAHHFRVTARTVQLWEVERGLPVHRKTGPKGRVFAFRDELDAWNVWHALDSDACKNGVSRDSTGSGSSNPADPLGDGPAVWGTTGVDPAARLEAPPAVNPLAQLPERRPHPTGKWPRWSWVAVATLLLVAVGSGAFAARGRAQKTFAAVDVTEHTLRGLDRNGRTLWTFAWPEPYHAAFAQVGDPLQPLVIDLDEDGEKELYIWHQVEFSEGRPEFDATLYAFDAAGNIRWTFQVPDRIRTARREYVPPYAGRTIKAIRYDGGRKRGLMAVASHNVYHPSRVMLLSEAGELVREYLHSGHVHTSLVDDLDGDGHDEIYALGITNTHLSCDLVVLDPDTMGGASAETPDYQLAYADSTRHVALGVEKGRWVLPRTALSKALEPYSTPGMIRRDGDMLLVAMVEGKQALPMGAVTYFRLTPGLELVATGVSDNFAQEWDERWKAGVLRRPFSRAELEVLNEVLVLTPTREASLRAGSD